MRNSTGVLKLGIRICFLLLAMWAMVVHSQTPEIKIVANQSVLATELSASQLRSIFSMKQSSWPDGQPIKVFVLASEHPSHQQFCKRILRMFPYQMERTWNKLTYSGLGDLPVQVQSEEEMLKKVNQHQGAIGYVIASNADAGMHVIRLKTE